MAKIAGNKPKTIRKNNLGIILELYRTGGPHSVSGISEAVKLSRTTVSKINEKLLSANLLKGCGKGESTGEGGKKPELYCLDSTYGAFASFHVREDFVSVKYFDITLAPVKEKKIRTESDESLEGIVAKIAAEVNSYREKDEPAGKPPLLAVSVAIHGIVDSERGVCLVASHFPSWGTNRNICAMISESISARVRVHVDSWIRFKAYSAKRNPSSEKYRNYILLDAGLHGIVSGVVIDGRLLSGSHYLSGEIGHTVVSATETEKCYCGGRGCLETFIDCKRLLSRALSMKDDFSESSIFSETEKPDIFDIFRESNRGDPLACLLMDELAGWLAVGLSNLFMMFDPEAVFFEGDYSKAGEYFEKKLLEKIKNVSFVSIDKDFRVIFHTPESNKTAQGAAAFARDYYLFKTLDI